MGSIDNLLNLFRVDAQVRGLRSRLDSARRYLNAQEKLLKELQQQSEELQTRRRQTLAKIQNLEVERSVLDQRIEKYRNDLNNAVNSKQYSTVLSELNTIKTQRNELEDRILEEMERVEGVEKEAQALDAQLRERKKVRDVAAAELTERQAEVGTRLGELESERDTAAAVVPAADLAIFNSIGEIYDGEAMAQLEEIDRKSREYACGACNVHTPFEIVSVLLTGSNQLVRCNSCGRILYMQESMRGSLVKK